MVSSNGISVYPNVSNVVPGLMVKLVDSMLFDIQHLLFPQLVFIICSQKLLTLQCSLFDYSLTD